MSTAQTRDQLSVSAYIVETHGIRFSYHTRQTPIVQALSLQIPRGVTFGLLGQNGAGKSTVLKLIAGLLHPDAGKVYLFGKSLTEHGLSIHKQTGILIEDPPLYSHLSGRDNLRITCLYRGLPLRRIEEVLSTVQLTDAADKRVSSYSTGMKQRLGVGLALLPDPDLLILDEPTNGLDPQGIIEMRNLINHLHQQREVTIILSSHLLHEVERTCDYIGIIQQGKLLYQGSVDALKKQRARHQEILIRTSDNAQARQLLAAHGFTLSADDAAALSFAAAHPADTTRMIDLLRQQQLEIYEVTPKEDTLEDIYLYLTQSKTHEHFS